MLSRLSQLIRQTFFEGHTRSIRAKQNIVALFFLRGGTLLANFLLVPMTLGYLENTKYGIWLTLSSIVGSVSLLDVGLGNGLRNKFAEAKARGDDTEARMYVSTTYASVGIIVLTLIIVFECLSPFLSWSRILNTPVEMEPELHSLVGMVFIFFCLRLLFGLIGTLLIADQKPAISSSFEVLVSLLSLGAVVILRATSRSSLFWLGFCVSSVMALVPLMATIWLFATHYRRYRPSLRLVDVTHAKELIHLGLQFYFLQIVGVVVFASSNIVITQLFGPEEVVPYNIAFKYYGVATMLFTILLTPFWSAFTEAYVRKDTDWILMATRRLRTAWFFLLGMLVLMTVFADAFYTFWVGKAVRIPWTLSATMAIYVLIVAWSSIFAYFMNGTGKIRLQLWVATAIAVFIVPLVVFFAKIAGLGSTGVVLATCICLTPGCFIFPIQMKKLLTGRATGIWGR